MDSSNHLKRLTKGQKTINQIHPFNVNVLIFLLCLFLTESMDM